MTIIMRSAIEFWSGKPAPPDLHHIEIEAGHPPGEGRRIVSYADHMAAKRERQRRIIENRCRFEPWRAWRFSVWWSPGLGPGFFQGYHGWFDRPGHHDWVRYGCDQLMRLFPLTLAFDRFSRGAWLDWLQEFVRVYRVGHLNGHPRAAVNVWRRGYEIRKAKETERLKEFAQEWNAMKHPGRPFDRDAIFYPEHEESKS